MRLCTLAADGQDKRTTRPVRAACACVCMCVCVCVRACVCWGGGGGGGVGGRNVHFAGFLMRSPTKYCSKSTNLLKADTDTGALWSGTSQHGFATALLRCLHIHYHRCSCVVSRVAWRGVWYQRRVGVRGVCHCAGVCGTPLRLRSRAQRALLLAMAHPEKPALSRKASLTSWGTRAEQGHCASL